MAKYEYFVEDKMLPISEDEFEKWKEIFKKYISTNENFKDFKISSAYIKYNNGFFCLEFKAMNLENSNPVKSYDGRIVRMSEIEMDVYKLAGHIEEGTPNENDCPEFLWVAYSIGWGDELNESGEPKKIWCSKFDLGKTEYSGSEFEDFDDMKIFI